MTHQPAKALPRGAPAASFPSSVTAGEAAASSGHPRVLIINYRSLNRKYATGITISGLFAGWPRDRLAQIYVDGDGLDETVCGRHWRLTRRDSRLPVVLHRVADAYRNRAGLDRPRREDTCKTGSDDKSGRTGTFAGRTKAAIRAALMYAARGLTSYHVSPPLRRWIEEFEPEAIYSALEESKITALVQLVAKTYRVPVLPHFLDDWLTMPMSWGGRQGTLSAASRRHALSIMAEAPVRMVVGDRMAEEYGRRYGLTFVPFMNCVDMSEYREPIRRPGGKFVFAYCGGLHSDRLPQLLDIGHALNELRAQHVDVALQLSFGAASDAVVSELGAIESITCLGSLPPAEVATVMSHADCLVLVEAFEDGAKAYMKYSVSAKLPEYLRAGRPILGYGPGDLGSMRHIRETGSGLVVGERDATLLRETMRELIQNEMLRLRLGRAAFATARERHDAASVREEFRDTIATAVLNRKARG